MQSAHPSKKVPLEEEIYNLNSYIELMQIRYKDKFHMVRDYEDHLADCLVMKLLFQPLVENSIYHSIKESNRFGYIKIKIRELRGKLHITNIDTGLGMTRKRLVDIGVEDVT